MAVICSYTGPRRLERRRRNGNSLEKRFRRRRSTVDLAIARGVLIDSSVKLIEQSVKARRDHGDQATDTRPPAGAMAAAGAGRAGLRVGCRLGGRPASRRSGDRGRNPSCSAPGGGRTPGCGTRGGSSNGRRAVGAERRGPAPAAAAASGNHQAAARSRAAALKIKAMPSPVRRGRPGRRRRSVTGEPELEDRRAQITRGAAAVLSRQGYEATSMKEIADEVGVSSGLLHYYFGTKEDLLAEVVRSLHDQLITEWREAMHGVEDPLERVTTGLQHAARRLTERPESWQL